MADGRIQMRADTIGELRKVLDRAIELYGLEAEWWGFDDGCVIIGGPGNSFIDISNKTSKGEA